MNELIRIIDVLDPKDLPVVQKEMNALPSFSASEVFSGNQTIRTSSSTFLAEDSELALLIHERINTALLSYLTEVRAIHAIFGKYPVPGGVMTSCNREALQLLRYEPGQKYVFHHDVADHRERKEYHRTISVVLYLNEDFQGGATQFPHRSFKPRAGQALIFPSTWCYPHAGQEVTAGVKYVCVTWYYSKSMHESGAGISGE